MKKLLINISFVVLAVSLLASCKKFLERPPEGQKPEEEAFKTEQDLMNFANGVYTLIGDGDFFGGRHTVLNELLGDHYKGDKFTGDFAEIYKRQNSFFGGTRDGYYSKGYSIIARANQLQKKIDLASTNRDYIEGQAKFFRGFAHFELVRMFSQPWGYTSDNSHAGIPLRTSIDLGSLPRATVKEVYDQVIADLLEAEAKLPADPANGKFYTATKWAAKAYLAKVYFQMNDFANAYKYANEVITSNKFTLDANYANRYSNGLSTEAIFAIANQIGSYEPGSELRGNFRSDVSIPTFTLTDQFYAYATSKAADVRKAAWYSNTLHPGNNVLTKYNRNNFVLPIVHLTEIKLIRAESGAETGANLTTAINDINDIMTRAYGGTTFNLPANATAATVINTVRTERELELVAEGNRVQEIKRIGVRNNTNVDRRNSPWNCNGFVLQFPKAEQDANLSFVLNPEGGCF